MSEEELTTQIADASEIFINNNNLCKGRFLWQRSCSAFSVSKNDVDKVCKYILRQPEHHKKLTFAEEYDRFLKFYLESLSEQK
jgi:hypothetical protein